MGGRSEVLHGVKRHLSFTRHHVTRLTIFCDQTDLEDQVDTHQRLMHDLRREKFVTQGAFMAAQLCKADQGALKSVRRKLDLVCELLISAGILEETACGGLGVREEGEGSESRAAIPEVDADTANNTAFLEEGLACVEESIERVEREAKAASDEAQRAAVEAANASARSEKAVTQCRRVDERCTKVDELSRQAEAGSAMAIQDCRRRLDQALEESGERVETNSTRIFHLAAEVEGFVKAVQGSSAAATGPLAVTLEETGHIFPVEVADLPPDHQRPGGTTEVSDDEAGHRREAENYLPATGRANNGRKVTRELLTPVDVQGERTPGHPGLLSQDLTQEEARARSSFLAERLKQAVSPPGWRRRHSTYISRRAAASSRSKARLIASPVRPQEDPPATARRSWSRASSWPSLANEGSAAGRDKLDEDDEVNAGDEIWGRRDKTKPNLGMPPYSTKQAGTTAADAFNEQDTNAPISRPNDDLPGDSGVEGESAGHAHQSESSSQLHQGGHAGTMSESQRSSTPLESLARMTAKEVAEALSTTPVGKRYSGGTRDTAFDDMVARSPSPGSQLANLVDTPTLHSHGDTWGAKSSSSDGSSTTVTGGRVGQLKTD